MRDETFAARVSSSPARASKTTFPLWIRVRTFSQPSCSNIRTSAGMGSLFLPPTLMPRSRARWEGIDERL